MLYTYMSVTENDITLYGFLTQDEYELFLLLITVNGIGPKLAVNALGAVTPDTLRLAISQNNMSVLTKLPGIGKKTAQKLILELKDKLNLEEAFEQRLAGKAACRRCRSRNAGSASIPGLCRTGSTAGYSKICRSVR